MATIEARDLTKVYRTYRKESGLRGAIKGLFYRRYDETRAADRVTFVQHSFQTWATLGWFCRADEKVRGENSREKRA